MLVTSDEVESIVERGSHLMFSGVSLAAEWPFVQSTNEPKNHQNGGALALESTNRRLKVTDSLRDYHWFSPGVAFCANLR